MKLLYKVLTYLSMGATIILVLLSPLLLQTYGKMLPLDIDYISKVGGSYGAISALLSGIALCYLTANSVLQVRQTQISQLQAARTMQLELLKMSMENPTYRGALGSVFEAKSEDKWRMHSYINLWTMHFQMAFIIGSIEEKGLRSWLNNELFDSEHGREFWSDARAAYQAEQASRKHKKFFRIIESEYRKSKPRQDKASESAEVAPKESTLLKNVAHTDNRDKNTTSE